MMSVMMFFEPPFVLILPVLVLIALVGLTIPHERDM